MHSIVGKTVVIRRAQNHFFHVQPSMSDVLRGNGTFSPTATPAGALLAPMKEVLEGVAAQHELMKEVVAALQDIERGKHASLSNLLVQLAERQAARDTSHLRSEVPLGFCPSALHLPVLREADYPHLLCRR